MLGNLLGGTGSTPGGFPAGSALTIAALAVALLAFLLYLAGAPGTLPGKLLSLIIPASLTRRPPV